MERPSASSIINEENPSVMPRKNTEIPYQPTSPPPSVSHRRSNTAPSRSRKSESIKASNAQTPTHLPSADVSHEITNGQTQPFSPSLLPIQPRRRIRAIDDTDDVDSQTSSTN